MRRSLGMLTGLLILAGCAETLDSAMSQAGSVVGTAAGDAVGEAVVRQYTPMMRQWYASFVFTMAFGAGGYYVQAGDYAPGQWTRWADTEDEDSWLERAYLGDDESGNQWWKVSFHDGESDETMILEALLSPDLGEMKRLRARWPDRDEAEEVALQDETWYVAPAKISEESLEGAKVGTETVEVPAGSFRSDHLRFGNAQDGTWEWWLSEAVPGGVVKNAHVAPEGQADDPDAPEGLGSDAWTLVLMKYGEGARSELGSLAGPQS